MGIDSLIANLREIKRTKDFHNQYMDKRELLGIIDAIFKVADTLYQRRDPITGLPYDIIVALETELIVLFQSAYFAEFRERLPDYIHLMGEEPMKVRFFDEFVPSCSKI